MARFEPDRRTLAQFDPEHQPPVPDDLLSVEEAVVRFGLSRRTLFRLMTEHSIPRYRRPGDRKTYVSRSALEAVAGFRKID